MSLKGLKILKLFSSQAFPYKCVKEKTRGLMFVRGDIEIVDGKLFFLNFGYTNSADCM
jgi:hypothetical protein